MDYWGQFDLKENVVMMIGCFPFIHLDRYEICDGSLCMRCSFDMLMVSSPMRTPNIGERSHVSRSTLSVEYSQCIRD